MYLQNIIGLPIDKVGIAWYDLVRLNRAQSIERDFIMKSFKTVRFAALLLALVTAAIPVLTACSTSDSDLLQKVKSSGKLVIATEGDWAPWTYHGENDELVGFDVEIGALIAQKLGVEPEFKETMWDSILAGVSSGTFDIACNGVGYTEERAESMSFSKPYAQTHMVLVVKKDNDTINSFEDLNGKTTANTISSTYAQVAQSYGANVTSIDSLSDTIELLTAGRIDATLNSEDTILYYIQQHPDANIRIAAEAEGEKVVFPVAKGEKTESFVKELDRIIDELRESGELKRLSEKYFGKDLTEIK